jgi:hypothetical protein
MWKGWKRNARKRGSKCKNEIKETRKDGEELRHERKHSQLNLNRLVH